MIPPENHVNVRATPYAFGLLGAFTLTSVGLDRIRWQERRRNLGFWIGVLTSVMIVGSWTVNLVHKPLATLFGGGVTLLGVGLAYAVRRGVFGARTGETSAEAAEASGGAHESATNILTLSEAIEMRSMYSASTLVAMRSPNVRLFKEAAARVRGGNEETVYLLFVDEVPGLFYLKWTPIFGPKRTEVKEKSAALVLC